MTSVGGSPDGVHPEHAGEIISLIWPWNAMGSPLEVLDKVAGERDGWTAMTSLLPVPPNS